MKTFWGVPASEGAVFGKAFLWIEAIKPQVHRAQVSKNELETEWQRFIFATQNAKTEIEKYLNVSFLDETEKSFEEKKIFETHLMMLEDPLFFDAVKTKLERELVNVEYAVAEAAREIERKLRTSPFEYFRERADDVTDVERSILRMLSDTEELTTLADLTEDVVLIARDILPSDLLTMNRKRVKALVLEQSSKTSHAAILARSFGIPAVVGLLQAGDLFAKRRRSTPAEKVFVDGTTGEVVLLQQGDSEDIYVERVRVWQELQSQRLTITELAETIDGHIIKLFANIGSLEETPRAIGVGAEGIGLFRTEFLFMNRKTAPDEQSQFEIYKQVALAMGNKPVIIRTADLGGDKDAFCMGGSEEKNPLLGKRALRLSLANSEQFRVQLRAILRAGAFGNLSIMFPLITSLAEMQEAKAQLELARLECVARGQAHATNMKVGCMIETPGAALLSDFLACNSDFFSIGTNDLVQYTLAVDRNNAEVNKIAETLHPAVLRLIKITLDEAHKNSIPCAMCGELAGLPEATPLLLGLGLEEFSMNAGAIPAVRERVRSLSQKDCRMLAEKALCCGSADEVKLLLANSS